MGGWSRMRDTRVLGIDLGSQRSCLAELEHMGATECIRGLHCEPPVTEVHRLPSAVTFRRHGRVFGEEVAAAAVESSDYGNTARGFKRLHGRTLSEVQAEGEWSGLRWRRQACVGPPLVEASSPLPDSVGLRVAHRGRTTAFSVEQLTAMLLKWLIHLGSGGQRPVDEAGRVLFDDYCVISVPGHFSDAARRSVATAASMVAGLDCLALVNETTAAAAQYAWTTRRFGRGAAGKRKQRNNNVVLVVVDLGHSGYQVAAYSLDEEEGVLRILASACDLELSGEALDEVLVSHFCQEFRDKYQLDLKDNPRALGRLTLECEKLKRQMSSTSSDLPLDAKSLLDFADVRRSFYPDVCVNRERFEKMCGPLLDKVDGLLRAVMEQAGLNAPDDVDAVQIVGGVASQMPAVRKRIGEVLGVDKLDDASDDGTAVARGCAALCSLLEPTLPTWRKLEVYDLNTPYPVVASSSVKSRSVPKPPMKGTPLDKQLVDRFVEDEAKMSTKDRLVEYIDWIRRAVDGPLQLFVGAGEQTLLLQALVDAEKWMEEERVENEEDRGGRRCRRRRHDMHKELMWLLEPIQTRQTETEWIWWHLDDVHRVVEEYAARIGGQGNTDAEERLSQAKEWLQEKRVLQSLQDPTQEPSIKRDDIQEYKAALARHLDQARLSPESAKNKMRERIREMMLCVAAGGPLKRFVVEEERDALLRDVADAMAWLEQGEEPHQPRVYQAKWDPLETRVRLFMDSYYEAEKMIKGFASLCMEVRDQTKYVKAYREKHAGSRRGAKVLNRSERVLYHARTWLEDHMDLMMTNQELVQKHNVWREIEAHHYRKLKHSSSSLASLCEEMGLV